MSAGKISAGNAAHYVWGDGCDGWHLVNQPSLSVIRERMPPGTAEVRHVHGKARQFFFVLEGRATLEAGGRVEELEAGEGLEIEPGTPHRLANRSGQELQFLVISQPHSHGDRLPGPAEE